MSQPSNRRFGTWPSLRSGGRRLWLWLALAVVAVGGAWGLVTLLHPGPSLTTFTVTRGDIHATVTANAQVRAVRSARLAFPIGGQVARVLVQEGDAVRAGDPLMELNGDDLDRRVQQAQLALQARQLDLARAQAAPRAEDLDIAQANVKKAALALAVTQANAKSQPSAANDAAQEAAQADYDIARANFDRLTRGPSAQDVQALQNAIASAQLDLEAARSARAQAQLRAPYDGIVTEVDAQPNELVGGYAPVLAIADLTHLELLADIDEIDVGAVAGGQAVQVRFDAFGGQVVNGQVLEVFPAASTDRGATVYHARVEFTPGDLAVRPGMGATITIATVEKKGVLLVPSQAVKDAGSQKVVAALVDGVLRQIVVRTGLSDGKDTEIVSGLTPGMQVVVE